MSKRVRPLLIIGIVVFLVIAIVSGWKVVSILKNYRDSEKAYEDAADEYTVWEETQDDAAPTPMTAEAFEEAVANPRRPILDVDFDSLQAENGDVFGWIYSKGTQINYPVVQGSDNVFYMDHLYNEEWNPGGAIFMDYRNLPAFGSGNSILYGHHMEDGSMFENVTKYGDQEYMDSHAILWFLTPEQDYMLLPFSAYITDATGDAYVMEFGSDEERAQWIENRIEWSYVESMVEVKEDDPIVTLSTCTYEYDNARFVLHCVLRPIGGNEE